MNTWIEISSTDSEQLKSLALANNVHPLALEDCLHRDQRAKLDDFGEHQLLVWFLFSHEKIYELQFLIFKDKIICVPHDNPPQGSSWKDFLKIQENNKDVWHLLYQALDKATDLTWQEMRKVFLSIDSLEEDVFKTEMNTQSLLQFKKLLNQIDYSVGHLSSVVQQLQNFCNPTDDLNWKLRDLYDHCERFYRSISMYRSQIITTVDLYWGVQANRTNRQMKKLSLLASVALPLTFWASFWGMNFHFIPFDRIELFVFALGIMMLSVMITLWLLVKKGYWND